MTDAEFGIWMMESLELLTPLEEELRKSARLLPKTSDHNVACNSQVLLEDFRKRHQEQDRKAKAMEGGTVDA